MKPFFIIILSLLVLSGCHESQQCEEEIYLLPEGFRGKIIVFFDQPDGQIGEYENTARLYHIPASGFIKSQFPKNGGCMNDNRIHFFYEDSTGTRQKVDYFLDMNKESIPNNRDFVMFSLLNETGRKPDFVIHLVGNVSEFSDMMQSVKLLDPSKILDSL